MTRRILMACCGVFVATLVMSGVHAADPAAFDREHQAQPMRQPPEMAGARRLVAQRQQRIVRDRMLNQGGTEPVGSTSAEFADLMRRDMAQWAKVVKESGARVD